MKRLYGVLGRNNPSPSENLSEQSLRKGLRIDQLGRSVHPDSILMRVKCLLLNQ